MVGDLDKLKQYIEKSWAELTVSIAQDTDEHYGLPHAFVAPSVHKTKGFVFREQFYWDSYFTLIGLAASGKQELALGMTDNLLFMQKKFGYIPNSNNKIHSGRSQPPLLSSMVLAGYATNRDDRWLEAALHKLEAEYNLVWRGTEHPHHREVYKGLSRYYHESQQHHGAEEESGWDYTNRFADQALDYVAIDLNALLFKYESDIAMLNELLGHAAPDWYRRADERKQTIDSLMWSEERGLFFDYNYLEQRQSSVASLASYVPLFVGLANKDQAARLVENLQLFQTNHGLTTTAITDTDTENGHQWMSPNGWAPLHLFVVEGLHRYGFADQAKQIAKVWVQTVLTEFEATGRILEKYNVIDPSKPPVSAVYPDQVGFAWTNAVTLHFMNSYLD